MKAQKIIFEVKIELQLSLIVFKFHNVDIWNVVISAQFQGLKLNIWLFAHLVQRVSNFTLGNGLERCPKDLKKKRIRRFLEPQNSLLWQNFKCGL